jgi:hypothetical protein
MATKTIRCRFGRIVPVGDGQYEWQTRDTHSRVTSQLRSLPFMVPAPRSDRGIALRFFAQHLADVQAIASPPASLT